MHIEPEGGAVSFQVGREGFVDPVEGQVQPPYCTTRKKVAALICVFFFTLAAVTIYFAVSKGDKNFKAVSAAFAFIFLIVGTVATSSIWRGNCGQC